MKSLNVFKLILFGIFIIVCAICLTILVSCNGSKQFLQPEVPTNVDVKKLMKIYQRYTNEFDPKTDLDYYLFQFNKLMVVPTVIDTIQYTDTLKVQWSQRHYYVGIDSYKYPEELVLPFSQSYFDTLRNDELNYVPKFEGDESFVTGFSSVDLLPGAYEMYLWCQPKSSNKIRSYRAVPSSFLLMEKASIDTTLAIVTPYKIFIQILKKAE